MRILFFGTPDFAVPSLKTLIDAGEDIIAVVTQPDRVKGRGHALSAPPVKQVAVSEGIPVLQPSGVRTEEFLSHVSRMKPDAVAVVAYGKIIPPSLIGLPPLGCVNVHASLLPKYRGAAPIQWAIINGEEKTGVTTMLMNEGLDTGDILLQEEMQIGEEDDAYTIALRLSGKGASLLYVTLQGLHKGTLHPRPQSGDTSYARPLRKEDGKIDWSWDARRIFNLVRGTFPWPGAYCRLSGERIVILRAIAREDATGVVPGRVRGIDDNAIYIGTGKGFLAVLEVKPEGRKAMSAGAFARGKRLKEGDSFDLS